LLRRAALEHSLKRELAFSQFLHEFSVVCQLFNRRLLASITRFLITDGLDESSEVEHFSFDPVPNVNERIRELLSEKVKFVF